jgi:flagellar motor switch protein FliM
VARKTLNQAEIDALFSAGAASGPGEERPRKTVKPCDYGQASQLTDDHMRAVTALHETFVRRLSTSLGAYLRVGFDMKLVAAEKLKFEDYLNPIGDLTYLASLRVLPIGARAALQVDLELVYPIVDLVLGGRGDPIELRGLTEIEEQIFETVVRLMVRDLEATWAPILELDIQFERRLHRAQAQGLMFPMESVLSLNFEIRLPAASGSLSLAFPAAVANALLRKLSISASHSQPIPSVENQRRLRQRLLGCEMTLDLSLPASPLPVRDLISLEPGRILTFSKRVREPIHLSVAGRPAFLAFPVCEGARRAARIAERLPATSEDETDAK